MTTTFNSETLPLAVVVKPGQTVSISTILKDEFGAAAADISSVRVGYWDATHLADYTNYDGKVDPLRYWTSDDEADDSANPSCVMTSWVDDKTGVALPGSTDNFVSTKVASTAFGEIALSGGTDIAPFAYLQIPAAYDDGAVTVYDQYDIVVEAPGTQTATGSQELNFSGPAYPLDPRPSDVIAAAYAYNAAYEGAPNDNDCSNIAEDIAAAAGAALPYHSQSIDPANNISQGFWRIVYQGADASDDNSQWDIKGWDEANWDANLKPGDIVRIGWKNDDGVHCFTVVGATDDVVNGVPVWQVFDNEYRGPKNDDRSTSIGKHDDIFKNGNSYYNDIDPDEVTVYRLTDDDLYLITGDDVTQTLFGNTYDDLFVAGSAGDDTIYGGSGVNTFVDTRLHAAQTTIAADGDDTFTLSAGGVTDTVTRVAYVELDDAAAWLHGSTATEIAGHNHTQILFASASGTLSTWQTNGTALSSAGTVGAPGADWALIGASAASTVDTQDLVFQNATDDEIALWRVFGSTIVSGAKLAGPGGTWRLVAVDDLVGDTQLLWRDDAGDLAIWYVADGQFSGGGFVDSVSGVAENPGPQWTFVGTGNFTGNSGAINLLFKNASGTFATWTLDGAVLTGGAALGATSWTYRGTGDFTGDGTSDVLFENVATGDYEAWLVKDDSVSSIVSLGAPGPDWAFKGIEDFSGNGESDILFENVVTGQYATWDLSGGMVAGLGELGAPGAQWSVVGSPPAAAPEAAPEIFFQATDDTIAEWSVPNGVLDGGGVIGNPGSGWTMLGVGDFYGDGESDILFENDGTYALWRTDDSTLSGGATLGAPPGSGWTFAAIGDFNGDGSSDILLENANGEYAAWDFNGQSSLGLTGIGNPGAGWTFKAAADFTGSGTSDLLFENASGEYAVWLIGDNTLVGGGNVGNPGAGWTFMGTGDFYGDGVASLLFENASGSYALWNMSGDTVVGSGTIGDPGQNWRFEGIADFNGNHASSILFLDTATGVYATWTLNGANVVAADTIGAPGSQWTFKAAV